MFFNLALLAIIVVCAGIMVLIFVRKFPQLTLIETESLPQVQNSARKKQIMDERVRRSARRFIVGTSRLLSPLTVRLRNAFRRLVHCLTALDRQLRDEQPLDPEQRRDRIARLRRSAADLSKQEKFGEAEKKLIEVLTFDEMNEGVYRDLGELYLQTKRWDHARETYAFLIRVLIRRLCGQSVTESHGVPVPRRGSFAETCTAGASEHAEIAREFANFSHICGAVDDWGAAKVGLETSLSFEPSNPKYLDLLVGACIMDGDKDRAVAALERLRAVNPQNKKLEVLQERVLALETKHG